MRVALVLEQCLQPAPGGTGRYAYDLATALARGAAVDDSVTGWVAFHRDVEAARVPSVAGPRRLILPRRPLAALWERGIGPAPRQADVVHAPTLLVPPRRGATTLVVTIHDAVPWTHPDTLTPHGVAFHKRMAARAVRSADLVVVPSEAVQTELAAVLALGDRIVVVPPGVTPNLARPPDVDERARRLGLPSQFVLSAATLEPRKGLDLLIEAMADPGLPGDLSLVVAGQPGWGGVDPTELAKRAGLSPDRLHVLGRISDADLATCFVRATIFAMPSRAEGFGLPVLEAMAAGVPVVCTDVPALVELTHGAARVVRTDATELAVALRDLAADEPARVALIRSGRTRSAQYDWARSADRLWALYRDR